ncbi:MAG: ribosome small subunit-dependent GTPase A [Flavobacteriales bacterium]|nr:ribosome small subunit-dependent GTPase A [Flavobacteriales bacterium]
MKGTIIKTTGKRYTVKTADGAIIQSRLKGKFRIAGIKSTNPIVVGDKVEIEQESELWMIVKLCKRKNHILRKSVNLSKQTHVIAANIDQAILIVTLENPITTTSFIDRFLVAAQSYGIEVLIIFNKQDIYNRQKMQEQKQLHEIYKKVGYNCISISVLQDDLKDIIAAMRNKVSVIAGHSGVGKSTLINKLQPNLNINTKEISDTHGQGQHTTTFSELYELDFGGSIIDTPGIRGLGLVEIKKQELGDYFCEFLQSKKKCKFHNCIHLNEPDCAVKLELEKGEIAKSRYESYLGMLEEDEKNYRTNDY